jgi:hypothetical protein
LLVQHIQDPNERQAAHRKLLIEKELVERRIPFLLPEGQEAKRLEGELKGMLSPLGDELRKEYQGPLVTFLNLTGRGLDGVVKVMTSTPMFKYYLFGYCVFYLLNRYSA